jgi:predicted lipoprotein
MRKSLFVLVVSISFLTGFAGCEKPNPKPNNNSSYDRKGMLTNLSTNIILPSYLAFKNSSSTLDSAIKAFASFPSSATLAVAQGALKLTYKQWQSVSAFEFGPAEAITFRINTNTYPADISQIESNINQNTYNPVLLANLAAKGLPTIDYLLFGTGADNSAILQQYTTDAKAANRKTYLALISAELKTNAANVYDTWKNSYSTTFVNADGTDVGSSTGLLVNQLIYDFENLKNFEIGVPAGTQSMGTTFPKKVQAYYSGISAQLVLLHLQALQNIYKGNSAQGDGQGLDDYLDKVNAKYSDGKPLNDVIKNQFSVALVKLQALSDPLSENIKNNNPAVLAAYSELQKLTVLLKTDMTSSLGILITFGDNDGD